MKVSRVAQRVLGAEAVTCICITVGFATSIRTSDMLD